jgi:adenine-specific DNA-methyltransferase
MSTLYLLYINDGLFTPCLELIRNVCEPDSKSRPHITVRGPVDRLYIDINRLAKDFLEIHIFGLDKFFTELKNGQLQNTLYLKCDFKELSSIYYKPDYPGPPHITLYDGESRAFAEKLLECVSKYSWNYNFRLSTPPILTEIKIVKRSPKVKTSERSYNLKLTKLFNTIAGKILEYNYLKSISDEERLYLVEQIINYLESSFNGNSDITTNLPDTKQKYLQKQLFEQYNGNSDILLEKRSLWGQFKTPPELANDIIKAIKSLLPKPKESIDFGDPAIGSGTFFSALEEVIGPEYIKSAIGIEIDPTIASLTQEYLSDHDIKIINRDFFELEPQQKRNLIVSNPPYVRFQLIGREQITKLINRVQSELKIHVSGYSSSYIYFILLSHNWLKKGAISAWLIPSEFLEVQYGAALRKYLTENVSLIRIHRFSFNDIQFERVMVTSTLIIFKNIKPNVLNEVKITLGGTIDQPDEIILVRNQILINNNKWTSHFLTKSEQAVPSLKLGDIFNIKRGIATGANSFFILKREEAIRIGIPNHCLRAILPNPQELGRLGTECIIERDLDGYPLLSPQLSVIDCRLDEIEIKKIFPSFWEYLNSAREKDILGRYLIRNRKPWYKQEYRERPIFLCTYMGRNVKNLGPFRFVLNTSDAIATNQYLLLYPKVKLNNMIEKNPKLIFVIYQMLNKLSKESMINGGRVYAEGLYKIEPGELREIDATIFSELMEDTVIIN